MRAYLINLSYFTYQFNRPRSIPVIRAIRTCAIFDLPWVSKLNIIEFPTWTSNIEQTPLVTLCSPSTKEISFLWAPIVQYLQKIWWILILHCKKRWGLSVLPTQPGPYLNISVKVLAPQLSEYKAAWGSGNEKETRRKRNSKPSNHCFCTKEELRRKLLSFYHNDHKKRMSRVLLN